MRISRAADNYIVFAHFFVSGLVYVRMTHALWDWKPWFTLGWHRAVSYLTAAVVATAVFTVPTFLLRRRYLRVEDRGPRSA